MSPYRKPYTPPIPSKPSTWDRIFHIADIIKKRHPMIEGSIFYSLYLAITGPFVLNALCSLSHNMAWKFRYGVEATLGLLAVLWLMEVINPTKITGYD